MATEIQIISNRKNALKSKGPKTAVGKTISARNQELTVIRDLPYEFLGETGLPGGGGCHNTQSGHEYSDPAETAEHSYHYAFTAFYTRFDTQLYYDEKQDAYVCPAGQLLTYRFSTSEFARKFLRTNLGQRFRTPSFHLYNSHRETIRIHFGICLLEAASYMVYGL
jgi:hypothetical protein